jgi:peptidyl-prolyl cis-trans isomerase D
MLDGLRNFAKTVPGKILGGLLLVGVAGFGINNVILDFGNNVVARVGDQEITTTEFQRAYSGEINRFASQYGSVPTAEEALNMGLPTNVIQRLSQDATLDGLVAQFELGVTEDRLGEMVRNDPNFAGTLGGFNRENFEQVLRANGLTEAEYIRNQERAAGREQLIISLFGDAELTDVAAQMLGRYIGDTRTIEYLVLNEAGMLPVDEPTDEDLATYLAENQADFRTVETRMVDVLHFSPETLAQTIEISDEDVAAAYEQRQSDLVSEERRTVQQVVLANDEQVAAFEAGLAAGTPFAELAETAGLTPTSLGTRARSGFTDAALAEAIFGLEEGDFAILPGATGDRAVYLEAVEPAEQLSLADASDTIRSELAVAEARDQYLDILDQIEELRAAFQPLDQIAERYGLPVETLAVTQSGEELSAVETLPATEYGRVAQAIFAAQQDRLTPAVMMGANQNVFFDLDSIEPVRDQTLDEARDAVAAAWNRAQMDAAIAERIEEIVARLDAGEALADIALEASLFTQLSSPFSRIGENGTAIDQTVANVVFAGGPDHHGSAMNEAGEQIVFDVVNVAEAGESLDEQTRAALADETQNALFADFVTGRRQIEGLRINQQALDQVLATSTGL